MTITSAPEFENILVAVRIRPLNEVEVASNTRTAWRIAQNGVLCFVQNDGTHSAAKFAYDAVFEGAASNRDVYEGVVAPMVDEALQGKNATFFAYGQTGSGKTYTMDAMMDLTADQIFTAIQNTPTREFLLKLSAVEVYNEAVHDLLRPPTEHHREPLDLREDSKKKIIVKSLIEEDIPSARHLRAVLRTISRHREVRATQHNENSSRSHQIVSILVESRMRRDAAGAENDSSHGNAVAGRLASGLRTSFDAAAMNSTITFVDLAGSEPAGDQPARPATTGGLVDRQRAQETSNINRSLLTLGLVIKALAENAAGRGKPQHVPFRASKLTRLLQPCLGGNSKAAILATVCPAAEAIENTRSTLNFASLAREVKVQPKVNVVDDSMSRIHLLESMVRDLRDELARIGEMQRRQVSPPEPIPAKPEAWEAQDSHPTPPAATEAQALLEQENHKLVQKTEALTRNIAWLERLVLHAPDRPRAAMGSCDVGAIMSATRSGGDEHRGGDRGGEASAQRRDLSHSMPSFAGGGSAAKRLEHSRPGTANPAASPAPTEGVTSSHAAHASPAKDPLAHKHVKRSLFSADSYPADLVRPLTPQPSRQRGRDGGGGKDRHTLDVSVPPPLWAGHDEDEDFGGSHALMAELRAAKLLGGDGPSDEGSHLRLARFEAQLSEMQAQQDRVQQRVSQRDTQHEQMISDLKAEIERLKASLRRETDARQAVAKLRGDMEQLADHFDETDTARLNEEDIDAIVRREALPGWVKDALTEASSHGNSLAVAPSPADAGEVATSRARPLRGSERASMYMRRSKRPATASRLADAAPSEAPNAGGAAQAAALVDRETEYGLSASPNMASPLAEPFGSAASADPSLFQPSAHLGAGALTDRRGVAAGVNAARPSNSSSSEDRTSSGAQTNISSINPLTHSMPTLSEGTTGKTGARAAKGALWSSQPGDNTRDALLPGPPHDGTSGASSMRSQTSYGSFVGDDDELKNIIVRAVHGMKAQEAERFKERMRVVQAKWRQSTERNVAQLQQVLQEYQTRAAVDEKIKMEFVRQVLRLEGEIKAQEETIAEVEVENADLKLKVENLTARVERLISQQVPTSSPRAEVRAPPTPPPEQPTAKELLVKIVDLWDRLHMPLLHRSSFVVAHRDKEVFFYQAELSHLEDLHRAVEGHRDALKPNKLALNDERNSLARRLKAVYSEEERAELYQRWKVTQIKERKKALAFRVWDSQMTGRDEQHIMSSAELVLCLNGWDGNDTSYATIVYPQMTANKDVDAQGGPLTGRSSRIASVARLTSFFKTPHPRIQPAPDAPSSASSPSNGRPGLQVNVDTNSGAASPSPTARRFYLKMAGLFTPTRAEATAT